MPKITDRFDPNGRIAEEDLGDAHQARIRVAALAEWFDKNLPEGREKALALTKLEESSHWVHSALRANIQENHNA